MLRETMLTLSTAHMTKEDDRLLRDMAEAHREDPGSTDLWVSDTGYGYLICVNMGADYGEIPGLADDQDRNIVNADLSDGILGAVRFARHHEARWLRFDRDGDIVNELPTWDW